MAEDNEKSDSSMSTKRIIANKKKLGVSDFHLNSEF